jgi:hypothetical protein
MDDQPVRALWLYGIVPFAMADVAGLVVIAVDLLG